MKPRKYFMLGLLTGIVACIVLWLIFNDRSFHTFENIPLWLSSLIISAITGGTMGAIVNNYLQKSHHERVAKEKEAGIIAALSAELQRSERLCEHNANLKEDITGPFIRFPTTAATIATFEERDSVPRLIDIQNDLEAYTMGIIHINQLIDLHQILWTAPEQLGGRITGGKERREWVRFLIADICAGKENLTGVGKENFVTLPTFIKVIKKKVDALL